VCVSKLTANSALAAAASADREMPTLVVLQKTPASLFKPRACIQSIRQSSCPTKRHLRCAANVESDLFCWSRSGVRRSEKECFDNFIECFSMIVFRDSNFAHQAAIEYVIWVAFGKLLLLSDARPSLATAQNCATHAWKRWKIAPTLSDDTRYSHADKSKALWSCWHAQPLQSTSCVMNRACQRAL
jgi:hypothetical protein